VNDYARFRERFAQALDPRLYSIEYLDSLLFTGKAQIWFADNAALVTELRTYPSGVTAICVVVAAGSKEEVVDILRPRAEAWAQSIGCSLVIVESREGWKRALRPHGYAPFQVSLAKEL
jgi:hypothetical protein